MIDIIGLIYKPTGVMLTDDEGFEYPEQAPIDGWHVNTLEEMPEWAEYEVFPTVPYRVFAGLSTFYYSFPDEETFRELHPEEVLDGQD
jgi:hypothetical protein